MQWFLAKIVGICFSITITQSSGWGLPQISGGGWEDGALAGSPPVPSQGLFKAVVPVLRTSCATSFDHSLPRFTLRRVTGWAPLKFLTLESCLL